MEQALERLNSGARVCVIRLRSLGDCVLTTPALALLHHHRPDLRISVVVEPRFAAVFERNPAVQAILEPKASAVFSAGADLTINLHGGTSSIMLTLASRATHRAGFGHFRAQNAYNIHIPRAQEILGIERKVHTAEHLASAMFYLGVPQGPIPRASLYPKPSGHNRPYAIVHPFASKPEKTWPADRFLAVAGAIARQDIEPLILCGPGEDASPFEAFKVLRGLPLPDVINWIGGASLFVGNDSGPAHIAAACAIPAVVLFADSDPVIWAPWQAPEAIQIVRDHIAGITTAEVLSALQTAKVRA